MARFDLVIFDCDGVVVDSERISTTCSGRSSVMGATLTEAEMHERFLGRRLAECLTVVEELTQRAVPPGALERYIAERDRVLREQVEPVAGIREVLTGLTIPYCIASSGGHDKMRITLGATGLLPLFEGRIFSANDVPRGKLGAGYLSACGRAHERSSRSNCRHRRFRQRSARGPCCWDDGARVCGLGRDGEARGGRSEQHVHCDARAAGIADLGWRAVTIGTVGRQPSPLRAPPTLSLAHDQRCKICD